MFWERAQQPADESERQAWLRGHVAEVAQRAVAPISDYHVGVLLELSDGRVCGGVNVEFRGGLLCDSIHAEQCAVTHAYLATYLDERAEKKHAYPVRLVVNAPPCGHCRQFLLEMEQGPELQIQIKPADGGPVIPRPLKEMIADYFSPEHLGVTTPLFASAASQVWSEVSLGSARRITASSETGLSEDEVAALSAAAEKALRLSYVPYSKAPSAVCLRTSDGALYGGMYIENAAYNPTLSPLHTAVINLIRSGKALVEVDACLLMEPLNVPVSHCENARRLFSVIRPNMPFYVQDLLHWRVD